MRRGLSIGTSVLIISLSICILSCRFGTENDSPIKIVSEFSKALNNADFTKMADKSCNIDGLHYSIEEAKVLYQNLEEQHVRISEVLREESFEQDESIKIVVVRVEPYPSLSKLFYFVVVRCPTAYKILVNGTNEIVSNEYPITENKEKARLLSSVAWFYAINKLYPQNAISLAKKAKVLAPEDPSNTALLAWSYYMAGEYVQAYYTMEGLVDERGEIAQPYRDMWLAIAQSLPPYEYELKIISPPEKILNKEGTYNLRVSITPNIYISVNNTNYIYTPDNIFLQEVPLIPDVNHIVVTGRKYLYAGTIRTDSVEVTWGKYRDNGNKTVTDLTTGLMWMNDPIIHTNWDNAKRICEQLSIGGYEDWRLPTANELRTVIDEDKGMIIDTSNNKYFGNVSRRHRSGAATKPIWTSTIIEKHSLKYGSKSDYHYYVWSWDFKNKWNQAFSWGDTSQTICVRDGSYGAIGNQEGKSTQEQNLSPYLRILSPKNDVVFSRVRPHDWKQHPY